MINDFMKAKARILILLIGMIGLMGFGNTTDPVQNSITNDFEYLTTPVMVCVTFQVCDLVANDFNEVYEIGNDSIATVFKPNLNSVENTISYDLRAVLKPPVFVLENQHLNKITEPTSLCLNNFKKDYLPTCNQLDNFRRARDGLTDRNCITV